MALARRLLSYRPVRFLLVGGINTVFGYAIFAALVLLGSDSALALLIATIAGVIFNYFTTGRLVFRSRRRGLFPAFVGAYAISYAFNLGLLRLLEGAGVQTLLAQALCLPPTVAVSYLLMKSLVFRNRSAS